MQAIAFLSHPVEILWSRPIAAVSKVARYRGRTPSRLFSWLFERVKKSRDVLDGGLLDVMAPEYLVQGVSSASSSVWLVWAAAVHVPPEAPIAERRWIRVEQIWIVHPIIAPETLYPTHGPHPEPRAW